MDTSKRWKNSKVTYELECKFQKILMHQNFKEILMYQILKRDTPVSDFQKEDTSASKESETGVNA